MYGLSPRNRLIGCLLVAGAGLALFFSGEYRDLGLPLGDWFGSLLFTAGVWFCVDAVQRLPRSEAEALIAPAEWQAWVGLAFATALVVAMLLAASGVRGDLPIGRDPDARALGTRIGTLFVAWAVLAQLLKQRWAGEVQADERDARIALLAGQWGRGATTFWILGIALLLGFSDSGRLHDASHSFVAHLLVLALVVGLWFDQAAAALLYWRDRHGVGRAQGAP